VLEIEKDVKQNLSGIEEERRMDSHNGIVCYLRNVVFFALIIACIEPVGREVRCASYRVGPESSYTEIGAVPWESLAAGDSVLIHWQSTDYHEKWVICLEGTETDPIVVKGIPGPGGERPVINGIDADIRPELDFWSESRCIIKIGGASVPLDCIPSHIIIEGLDVRNARPPYNSYDSDGNYEPYVSSASAIYVEKGIHLTIRDCVFRDNANGFFTAWMSEGILVEGCFIYDNGLDGSYSQHNSYCESQGITYQYNRYGPLRDGCGGNSLKDRSSGCVIRYNWIEGGNRQLDLVESDYSALYDDPSYRTTFVYGNVLIEPDGAGNSQICHYGGDNGYTPYYRKGTLHFYNNTVVSTRTGNTTLFRLSTNDEAGDCRNNIIYTTATGSHLAMLDETGILALRNNWLKEGWVNCHGWLGGSVIDQGGNVAGIAPGFFNESGQEFWITGSSECVDHGTVLAGACLPDNDVYLEYVKHQSRKARVQNDAFDMGAYEHPHDGGIPACVEGLAAERSGPDILLTWNAVNADSMGFPLAVDSYRVYETGAGHFLPSLPVLQTDTAETTYTDQNVAPDPLANRFYRVTAVKAGHESAAGGTVGVFDYDVSGQ